VFGGVGLGPLIMVVAVMLDVVFAVVTRAEPIPCIKLPLVGDDGLPAT